MYGLCLVEKAVRHVRPFEGLWNTAIYLSSTSSSSLSFIHTVQVHAQRKMKYSYARTYREQNSRDYNNWNIRFLNQRATAEVARTFFNLGSFSSMYNQRDNVLFCLRGGGAHTSIPRDKAYSSSPLLPCSLLSMSSAWTRAVEEGHPGDWCLVPWQGNFTSTLFK